jgi:hypothetical protein
MKEFWNERYGGTAYVYGTEPNAWFAQQLAQLTPGRILLPAEGEGRNAVHAARAGWDVTAFDISEAGRNKAMALAGQHGVTLEYHVGTLAEIPALPRNFDALGLVFAHFPAAIRASLTGDLLTYLRPAGVVIFEAFAKAQTSYQAIHQSGGPQQADMLYSVEEVRAEFPGIEFHRLEEVEVELREGAFHSGLARVVRGFGVKR